MIHAVTMGLGLFGLWLLLSGFLDNTLLLGLGVASCVACVYIAARMEVVDHESVPLQLKFGVFGYLFWLSAEIGKANWAVTKVILSPRMRLSQRMITVPSSQTTDVGRVTFANSITLTPGTITVETEHHSFLVHALTDEAADMEALTDMGDRVSAVENRT
ncbi:MAG: Na+/H+ antiporter subunit E [Rhodobiaceae bacterium]|nr:Na+/H+ antiporter subunit E [Rhodobiaceae bacterium]